MESACLHSQKIFLTCLAVLCSQVTMSIDNTPEAVKKQQAIIER
jgi:hypothetical protein